MNSENVATETSADAQATLCPFLRGGGGGGGGEGVWGAGYTFFGGG